MKHPMYVKIIAYDTLNTVSFNVVKNQYNVEKTIVLRDDSLTEVSKRISIAIKEIERDVAYLEHKDDYWKHIIDRDFWTGELIEEEKNIAFIILAFCENIMLYMESFIETSNER